MSRSGLKDFIIALNAVGAATRRLVRKRRITRLRRCKDPAPLSAVGMLAVAIALVPQSAHADEGGVSFWLPGIFGSLAAAPQQPGWALATIYYHTSVKAGADIAAARQIGRGGFNANLNLALSLNLDAEANLALVSPSYVFATPVLGGQLAVSLLAFYGRSTASVDGTLTASLGPLGFTLSGSRTDSVTGFGDLIPQVALRWNNGVHNYLAYATGDIPVGKYDPNSLANLGIGHGAVDAGFGYTYFNPQTGDEFSWVAGFTYNFINPDTQYRNGIDVHVDWATSKFVTKQLQLGLVGYFYNQITGDSGDGSVLGPFQSRVAAVGPQIGYVFPLSDGLQGYLNLKGYKEFAAGHRAEGWNTWLTFLISPAAPSAPPPPSRMVRK